VTISIKENTAASFVYLTEITSGNSASLNFVNWKFDSTTKIHICSELNGVAQIACKVFSFSMWYTSFQQSDSYFYFGGLFRKNK